MTEQNIESSLPEGWVETTINNVVEVLDGDRGSNYPNGDDFTSDGFCLFLNTKNVPGTQFSFSEKMFVTQDKDNLLRKGKLKRGDYVLTTRGTIGNFAYYHKGIQFDHIRINSGMVILRVDAKNLDEKYLGKYLNGHLFKHQFLSLQSGSAVPQLPIRDIKTFEIILPPLPEQKAIASVLSSFDNKIELLREQNKTLEATAQTIFKEWFGKYRIDDELPEGWRVGKIKEIIEIKNGFAFKSKDYVESGIPITRTMNFNNGTVKLANAIYLTKEKATEYKDFQLKKFDFLLVMVGASLGKSVITPSNILPSLQNQNMWNFRPKEEYIRFYNIFLIKKIVKEQLNSASGSAREFFRKDYFYSLDIIIPSKEIILDFVKLIKPLFEKIDYNITQIQSLSKTRDVLLPKLMKGEVRVEF